MVMFAGEPAVRVFQATVLASALEMSSRGIRPNRTFTQRGGLILAAQITERGKAYKRNELPLAVQELREWAQRRAGDPDVDIRP